MGVPASGCRVSVALLLLCSCIATATATAAGEEYARYRDPKQPLNRRIDDLLGRMNLAEKIGQMSQIERENATADVIQKYFIGIYMHVLVPPFFLRETYHPILCSNITVLLYRDITKQTSDRK